MTLNPSKSDKESFQNKIPRSQADGKLNAPENFLPKSLRMLGSPGFTARANRVLHLLETKLPLQWFISHHTPCCKVEHLKRCLDQLSTIFQTALDTGQLQNKCWHWLAPASEQRAHVSPTSKPRCLNNCPVVNLFLTASQKINLCLPHA